MRQSQQFGQDDAALGKPEVIGLESRQDQIERLGADRFRDELRREEAVEFRAGVIVNMDGAVRAFRQRLADRLLNAGRADARHHHFAAVFLLQAQGLFERECVRLIGFVAQIRVSNPGRVLRQPQRRVFGGNLFDAHQDFHGKLSCLSKGF